ncbi:MAG TPA: hypothetical protein VHP63_08380 [candidate division Zixibacteria bacterium]|nr:hypothetical protein [candidate division Zixibacteria bacterium]
MTKQMIKRILPGTLISATALLLFACENKIVAPPDQEPMLSISIDISDASPKLLAAVDQYQVIVIETSIDSILVTVPLTLNAARFITGTIDSLPTDVDLQFIAEARDMQVGVIFSGSTNAVLEADIVNNVSIDLSPAVPLMKFTPRHLDVVGTDTSAHTFDIKIFNVDSLYGVSFRVRYNSAYLRAINAKLDTSQNASQTLFFQFDSVDANGPYKAIAVTGISPANGIVDANGDGVLCNIDFALVQPFTAADSTMLLIEPTGMTHQNQSNIPTGILYNDDAFVRISP